MSVMWQTNPHQAQQQVHTINPAAVHVQQQVSPLNVQYGNQGPNKFDQVERDRKMNPKMSCLHLDHAEDVCPLYEARIDIPQELQAHSSQWTSKAKSVKYGHVPTKVPPNGAHYRLDIAVINEFKQKLEQCADCRKPQESSGSFVEVRCPFLEAKKGVFRLPLRFVCVPSHQSFGMSKQLHIEFRLISVDGYARCLYSARVPVHFRTHGTIEKQPKKEQKPQLMVPQSPPIAATQQQGQQQYGGVTIKQEPKKRLRTEQQAYPFSSTAFNFVLPTPAELYSNPASPVIEVPTKPTIPTIEIVDAWMESSPRGHTTSIPHSPSFEPYYNNEIDKLEADFHKVLKTQLEETRKQLQEAHTKLTNMEKEVKQLKVENKQLKVKNKDLKSQLQHKDQQVKLQHQMWEDFEERLKRLKLTQSVTSPPPPDQMYSSSSTPTSPRPNNMNVKQLRQIWETPPTTEQPPPRKGSMVTNNRSPRLSAMIQPQQAQQLHQQQQQQQQQQTQQMHQPQQGQQTQPQMFAQSQPQAQQQAMHQQMPYYQHIPQEQTQMVTSQLFPPPFSPAYHYPSPEFNCEVRVNAKFQ
eukprot:TRINITY_DN360_c0_g4_i1.p1 TRINITY_DN360_c0_g4~~TRINITY_DN360_c0_g4_i1.p1  ORF type:complete len:578 (-),score=128.31 TRINITY_DN360_c0_g4_i1:223-1956(-)